MSLWHGSARGGVNDTQQQVMVCVDRKEHKRVILTDHNTGFT